MYAILFSFLVAIPFGTLVSAQGSTLAFRARREVSSLGTSKTYLLQDWYEPSDFFSDWSFFTDEDPANGNVNYLSMNDAKSHKLAYVEKNAMVLAVDSTSKVPAGGKRNSVRIASKKSYTGGLFILDAAAMPVGCGTWPSFLTKNDDQPTFGEIDVVEGVGSQARNQMALHTRTSRTCKLEVATGKEAFTGNATSADCHDTGNVDAGCPIRDTDPQSFGPGFNRAKGGVYALLWDTKAGISIWHFARENIPKDIADKKPTPEKWGKPAGIWSSSTCDVAANFHDHQIVIDTTICGDQVGKLYGESGCPATCSAMVANATNFADAKWVINYVAVYH